MTLRDHLIRAQVYVACDLHERGDAAAFRAACADLVHLHRVLPLVEHLHLIEQAKRIDEERARRIPDLIELIRSTYREGGRS